MGLSSSLLLGSSFNSDLIRKIDLWPSTQVKKCSRCMEQGTLNQVYLNYVLFLYKKESKVYDYLFAQINHNLCKCLS
jgi:hypothetical protein